MGKINKAMLVAVSYLGAAVLGAGLMSGEWRLIVAGVAVMLVRLIPTELLSGSEE